ncbi:hypothetical protein [Kitasatospora sp. NPDC005856]|uniref:hypothetical protein n=1 Tax=Kitasatospora sp. NPDC005856 TaxID=3154566 RepID=UPI0033C8C2AC
MSGQYPGQFGPPPGGAPYGPGPGQGYAPDSPPAPATAAGPAPIPGRFGVAARVLCALAPLVSFGLLGAVPSLLLAVRRRRAYDILGAAVFCALLLAMIVSAGVAGTLKNPTADTTGQITLAVLWLLPTAHFLVMDSRAVWLAGPPAPQAAQPSAPPHVVAPYASSYAATTPGYGAPTPPPTARTIQIAPASPASPAFPAPTAHPTPPLPPAPTAHPAPETAHDLRELGELLRRQAREDRP